MGSTFLLDMHDVGSTLFFWRKALQIRNSVAIASVYSCSVKPRDRTEPCFFGLVSQFKPRLL